MLFAEMEKAGVRPDEITLVGVLCACAREEMVGEGLKLFRHMTEKYGIEPGVEHYRCLILLLDGSKAEMIKKLVMEFDGKEKRKLLMTCRELRNLRLEEAISSCMEEPDSFDSSVLMEVECFQWEVG